MYKFEPEGYDTVGIFLFIDFQTKKLCDVIEDGAAGRKTQQLC
jgi:hypothetical protein